jgi:hypothetical protein
MYAVPALPALPPTAVAKSSTDSTFAFFFCLLPMVQSLFRVCEEPQ